MLDSHHNIECTGNNVSPILQIKKPEYQNILEDRLHNENLADKDPLQTTDTSNKDVGWKETPEIDMMKFSLKSIGQSFEVTSNMNDPSPIHPNAETVNNSNRYWKESINNDSDILIPKSIGINKQISNEYSNDMTFSSSNKSQPICDGNVNFSNLAQVQTQMLNKCNSWASITYANSLNKKVSSDNIKTSNDNSKGSYSGSSKNSNIADNLKSSSDNNIGELFQVQGKNFLNEKLINNNSNNHNKISFLSNKNLPKKHLSRGNISSTHFFPLDTIQEHKCEFGD